MKANQMKEASSFETEQSLTKVFDIFDQIDLGHSQSDFGDSKSGFSNEEGSTSDHELGSFERIINWFKERKIYQGFPENICHTHSCKQREQMKLEDNKQISLVNSAILLRRGKKSQSQDRMTVLQVA